MVVVSHDPEFVARLELQRVLDDARRRPLLLLHLRCWSSWRSPDPAWLGYVPPRSWWSTTVHDEVVLDELEVVEGWVVVVVDVDVDVDVGRVVVVVLVDVDVEVEVVVVVLVVDELSTTLATATPPPAPASSSTKAIAQTAARPMLARSRTPRRAGPLGPGRARSAAIAVGASLMRSPWP